MTRALYAGPLEEHKLEHDIDEAITLRIYHGTSGRWEGRLFVGAEEMGSFAEYDSPEAVEEAARETGMYPDRVEVY